MTGPSKSDPKVASTLAHVARIYDLVSEMNEIVEQLAGMGVRVWIGGRATAGDPLAQRAVVELQLRTDMEPLAGRYG